MWILPQKLNRNKSDKPPREFLEDVGDAVLTAALINRSQLDQRSHSKFIKERERLLTTYLSKITGLSDEKFAHLYEEDEDDDEAGSV